MKLSLILSLLLPIFYFTCSPEIIDNKRAVVLGTIVDKDGSPIEGIGVRMSTSNYILGYGVSNAEGDFEFISLLSEDYELDIDVNYQLDNQDFTSPKYIYSNQLTDNQFKIGTVVLEKHATLDFELENSSGIPNIIKWSIEYPQPNCINYLNSDENFPIEMCYPQASISSELNSSTTSYKTEIQTIANEDAVFTYELEDGTIESISIPINPGQNTFNFEF